MRQYTCVVYVVRKKIKDRAKFFHPLRPNDQIEIDSTGMTCVYTETGDLLCSRMNAAMNFAPGEIRIIGPKSA